MADLPVRMGWHWFTMGPYHFARMGALGKSAGIELTVVETCNRDDHGWDRARSGVENVITLEGSALRNRTVLRQTSKALRNTLCKYRPDVVVAGGYWDPHSLNVMIEYRASRPGSLLLLWSESTSADRTHTWLGERVKRMCVSLFDGAFAAGRPHARYLMELGMPPAKIKVVGNCVDNEYFDRESRVARRRVPDATLPANYFLWVGRMIPIKNLGLLVDAYRRYRGLAGENSWDLVLVGSGPEEARLRRGVAETNLEGLHFAGSKQIDELPTYYGCASCFVLPSLSEPWGLVVNEAMAAGLPVLVSEKAGCGEDLVRNGENGFLFNPTDRNELAELMILMSSGMVGLDDFGTSGRRRIAEYTPELFAERVASHVRQLHASANPKHDSFRRSYSALLMQALRIRQFLPSLHGR